MGKTGNIHMLFHEKPVNTYANKRTQDDKFMTDFRQTVIKLIKGKAFKKHSLHEKTAASVFGLRPQTQPIYSFGFGFPIWPLFL